MKTQHLGIDWAIGESKTMVTFIDQEGKAVSKPAAPNFREVKACNNCAHSCGYDGTPGDYVVECSIHDNVYSSYNKYICDDYKEMVDGATSNDNHNG